MLLKGPFWQLMSRRRPPSVSSLLHHSASFVFPETSLSSCSTTTPKLRAHISTCKGYDIGRFSHNAPSSFLKTNSSSCPCSHSPLVRSSLCCVLLPSCLCACARLCLVQPKGSGHSAALHAFPRSLPAAERPFSLYRVLCVTLTLHTCLPRGSLKKRHAVGEPQDQAHCIWNRTVWV